MEAEVLCPHCGELIGLWIDEGGGAEQCYVEDCSICCRPFEVRASLDESGEPMVSLERLDD